MDGGTSFVAGQRPRPGGPWLALARVAPKFQGIASPGRWACSGVGTSPDHRLAGRRTILRPAYSGLWAVPTRGGHTPSDLLHGRSCHVGDLTRHRRRVLGPASSLFRVQVLSTLSHTPIKPAARRAAGTPVCPRSAHQVATEDQHGSFPPPGCRHLGAGFRAAVRRYDACPLQSDCGDQHCDPVVHGRRDIQLVEGRRLHLGASGAASRRPLGPQALINRLGPARHRDSRGSWTRAGRYQPPSDAHLGAQLRSATPVGRRRRSVRLVQTRS